MDIKARSYPYSFLILRFHFLLRLLSLWRFIFWAWITFIYLLYIWIPFYHIPYLGKHCILCSPHQSYYHTHYRYRITCPKAQEHDVTDAASRDRECAIERISNDMKQPTRYA